MDDWYQLDKLLPNLFQANNYHSIYIRLTPKFLSFYKEIIGTKHFLFYIILLNYVWSILFY